MVIPPLALERMSRVEADVVYGLYVSRHGRHQWLAFSTLAGPPDKYAGQSFSGSPELCKSAWGSVVESAGVGLGCTFVHRRVLEAIRFRNPDGMVANDWHFALDVKAHGFHQAHDCGVVCGHIAGENTYWPTEDGGYRAKIHLKIIVKETIAACIPASTTCEYLNITESDTDEVLMEMIVAQKAIESYTRRLFEAATDSTRYFTVGVDTEGQPCTWTATCAPSTPPITPMGRRRC
jgi:hypothetical protein